MEISRAFCSEGDAVRQDGTAAPSGRNIRCRQNRRLPGGKGGMLRRRAFLRSEIIKIRLSYSDGYFIFGSEAGAQRYPLWSACRLVSAISLRNNDGWDFLRRERYCCRRLEEAVVRARRQVAAAADGRSPAECTGFLMFSTAGRSASD